jgi:hypothetical protein
VTLWSEGVVHTAASLVECPISLDGEPPILRPWIQEVTTVIQPPARREKAPEPCPPPEPDGPSHRR